MRPPRASLWDCASPAKTVPSARAFDVLDSLRELIPPQSADELALLRESIDADGVREPLTLATWEGLPRPALLDGHHRLRIAEELGETYRTVTREFADEHEAVAWACTNQLGRRNLTDVSRVRLALRRKDAMQAVGRARQSQAVAQANRQRGDASGEMFQAEPPAPVLSNLDRTGHDTREELADSVGVSKGTFARAEQIVTKAAAPVLAAAESGALTTNAAYELTRDADLNERIAAEEMTVPEAREELKAKKAHVANNSGDNECATCMPGDGITCNTAACGSIFRHAVLLDRRDCRSPSRERGRLRRRRPPPGVLPPDRHAPRQGRA